ncbi:MULTISPECIES: DUF429 domain-containing protein [unclassified Sphingomonas]|uniref:DUF429 domain-containing protein n=1 Tax=unclassified Sphingomonas TaxID=196159 RepID=UPI0018E51623|nr:MULTISPECIES: DUF429 domain-containing protein [unclassified Sphingomonas]
MRAAETFVGFDSAWTDNPRAPGAICAVALAADGTATFHPPRLARFGDALDFIEAVAADYTLIALDQPTIVANPTGMRPAERVAAAAISWLGGGVQPASRARTGMFCDAAPIWPFLAALGANDDPLAAREAAAGRHVMEVFPALALAAFEPAFACRRGAPKYNPSNPLYRPDDWRRVAAAAATQYDRWQLPEPAAWCQDAATLSRPRKADQDRLDAMLCLAIALHWRRAPAGQSIMIGDLDSGYIVAPLAPALCDRLRVAAALHGVAIDGTVVSMR